MSPLATLARPDLTALARALRAGRLAPPFASAEVGRYVGLSTGPLRVYDVISPSREGVW